MIRKTNLFYNNGDDSKFLTFSNYSEALTGNFLSTDTKLFPSMFLCLYIPKLDESSSTDYDYDYDDKETLIKYLVAYYENKLAVIRDYYTSQNKKAEDYVYPLNYLLDTILSFDSETTIPFVGTVTEQDYNGTFTDTICVIDANKYHSGTILTETVSTPTEISVDDKWKSILYGWANDKIPSTYTDIYPLFDNNAECTYYLESDIKSIEISESKSKTLKFNVVIPLFDMVNVNNADEYATDDEVTSIDLSSISDIYVKNCPLGIWFSGDKPVELSIDDSYGQTWSLCIGSQFKPFPASNKIQSDITNTAKEDAFATFAQILTKQNEILDKFNNFSKNINDFNTRLTDIESNVKEIATRDNLTALSQKEASDMQTLTVRLNQLIEALNDRFSLGWQNINI